MAKKQTPKQGKSKFDLGGFFKGLLQRKKSPSDQSTAEADLEKSEPTEDQQQPQPTEPRRPKPVTKATITVSREDRVFQSIVVTGPPSGLLLNMEQILLRRGYDLENIPLQTTKRGTFERHELARPLPKNCECLILCEPASLDQAKSVISDITQKKGIPLVLICRQLSTQTWANEILKPFNLSDRFLIRFSFAGLQRIFRHIAAQPRPSPGIESGPRPPAASTPPPKKKPAPKPVEDFVPEQPPAVPVEPKLIEVEQEPDIIETEPQESVLATATNRPLAILAQALNEPMVHFRIKGKENEGVDPQRILTKREFERLFHATFSEKWNILRIDDPKAVPPILIDMERIPDESSLTNEEESPQQETDQGQPRPTAPTALAKLTQPSRPDRPADWDNRIKEVRRWWQQGRTTKLYSELDAIRNITPNIQKLQIDQINNKLVPIVEGTILFARGRLDRTIEGTLQELFTEDLSRFGIHASMRMVAILAIGRNGDFAETFAQAEEAVVGLLNSLIPSDEDRPAFNQRFQQIRNDLDKLDQLVERTLIQQKVSPALIYDYFENLHRITVDLHQSFIVVDPQLLVFGRLDQGIVRSQTRSDWAFDHAEESEQWKDRVLKFLHFLAQIRIETFRVRHEIDLLDRILNEGLALVIQDVAAAPFQDTAPKTELEPVDNDHLKEPGKETIWHILRHRGNYLIDLHNEENPNIRAFATFDEENISYNWLGTYLALPEQQQEEIFPPADTDSELPDAESLDESPPTSDEPEEQEK